MFRERLSIVDIILFIVLWLLCVLEVADIWAFVYGRNTVWDLLLLGFLGGGSFGLYCDNL